MSKMDTMAAAVRRSVAKPNSDMGAGGMTSRPAHGREAHLKHKPKRANRKGAPLLILAVLLLNAGTAAILMPVLTVEMEILQDTEEYEQFGTQFRGALPEESPQEESPATVSPGTTAEMMAFPPEIAPIPRTTGKTGVDMSACQGENEDFVAWIQIPGTTVDYPVVRSNDTEYYLNHTFSGKKSYLGTLFSLEKTDYRTPGKNIAIYGHHIRSNREVMFSPLISYKNQRFYAGHETIYLDSLYHAGTYTVFAVINMRSGDWDPSDTSFASDGDFLAYVQRAKSLSLYDTGIEVKANDQILTLITCDRSFIPKYGRLVVMAVKKEN